MSALERIVRVWHRVAISVVPRCYGQLQEDDCVEPIESCKFMRWGSQEFEDWTNIPKLVIAGVLRPCID